MNRVILLFLAVTMIGYYGWRKWSEDKKSRPQAQVGFDFTQEEKVEPKADLKDQKLHQAFAKILAKEKKVEKIAKRPKNRSIDELIQYNLETGSMDMTKDERKQVIEKLQRDVASFGGVISSLYAADQTEKAEEFEEKLEQKREQLENFRQLDKKMGQ